MIELYKLQLVEVARLAQYGLSWDNVDKAKAEHELLTYSDNLETRIKLIASYFPGNKKKYRHIAWMIEHAPESPFVGMPYCTVRIMQCPKLERNRILSILESVTPDRGWQAIYHRSLYEFEMRHFERYKYFINEVFNETNYAPFLVIASVGRALASEKVESLGSEFILSGIDKSLENFDKISEEEYADLLILKVKILHKLNDKVKLLIEISNIEHIDLETVSKKSHSRLLHGIMTIQGLIALENSCIDEAKRCLLESANLNIKPYDIGLPETRLASQILKFDQSATLFVVDYLIKCNLIWQEQQLTEWISELRDDKIPDFSFEDRILRI